MKRPSPTHGLRPKQNILGAIELLYVADAARLLACSEKAVRAKVARQILPHRRLGGRVFFLRAELEQFLHDLPGVSAGEAKANLALRSGEVVE